MQITECTFSKPYFTWDELNDISFAVKMGSAEQISESYGGFAELKLHPLNELDQNEHSTDPEAPNNFFLAYSMYSITIGRNATKSFVKEGYVFKKDTVMSEFEANKYSSFYGLTYEEAVMKRIKDGGAARAYPIAVGVTCGDGYGSNGRTYHAFKENAATLLLSRLNPVINGLTIEDTHPANPYGKFGGFIAGQSKPKITADVTLDPLDPTLTAKHKFEIWRGKSKTDGMIVEDYLEEVIVSAEADVATPLEPVLPAEVPIFLPDSEVQEGYNPEYTYHYEYTVTDSAGNSDREGGFLYIWNYSVPKLYSINKLPVVQRYIEVVDEFNNTTYEASDHGARVWVSLGMDVSSIDSLIRPDVKNGWTLTLETGIAGSEGNGTPVELASSPDATVIRWEQNRDPIGLTFSESNRHYFTFVLTDSLGNVSKLTAYVASASADFHIGKHGLGIGMRNQGSEDNKSVDVAPGYTFVFHEEEGESLVFPPPVTEADNGKVLVVVEGRWQLGNKGSSGVSPASAFKTINADMFAGYTEIESVDLPEATTLNHRAFQNCTGLKTVNLPAATTFGVSVFQGCTSLEKVDLGAITALLNYDFANCSSLQALILRGDTIPTITTYVFTGSGIANGTGYAYVHASLVESCKAANVWKNYAAQVRAIEDFPEITGG